MSKKTRSASISIGISEDDREKIANGLSALLADSYTLYLMTHNFLCICGVKMHTYVHE